MRVCACVRAWACMLVHAYACVRVCVPLRVSEGVCVETCLCVRVSKRRQHSAEGKRVPRLACHTMFHNAAIMIQTSVLGYETKVHGAHRGTTPIPRTAGRSSTPLRYLVGDLSKRRRGTRLLWSRHVSERLPQQETREHRPRGFLKETGELVITSCRPKDRQCDSVEPGKGATGFRRSSVPHAIANAPRGTSVTSMKVTNYDPQPQEKPGHTGKQSSPRS